MRRGVHKNDKSPMFNASSADHHWIDGARAQGLPPVRRRVMIAAAAPLSPHRGHSCATFTHYGRCGVGRAVRRVSSSAPLQFGQWSGTGPGSSGANLAWRAVWSRRARAQGCHIVTSGAAKS